jgi:excisionase family DNA binding protein
MEIKNLNLVTVPLETLSDTIRNIVAAELQKVMILNVSSNKNENVDEILTREQVCKLLKISNTTLFNWQNNKILENYKIGRRVYYKKSDVLTLLQKSVKVF